MVLHDFIYEWDGKSKDGEKPISWWPGSYHVKIIQLSSDSGNVSFLVPTIVLLKNTKNDPEAINTSLKNYIHTFARKISDQYDLNMEKTLWMEIDDSIQVVRFPDNVKLGDITLFSVPWRAIRPNELETIKPYLDDM